MKGLLGYPSGMLALGSFEKIGSKEVETGRCVRGSDGNLYFG